MGFAKVIVESDSSLTVSWIKNGLKDVNPCYGIIENCRIIFNQNSLYSINHVFRECNFVADCLANLSYEFGLGLHVPGELFQCNTLFGISVARPFNIDQ